MISSYQTNACACLVYGLWACIDGRKFWIIESSGYNISTL